MRVRSMQARSTQPGTLLTSRFVELAVASTRVDALVTTIFEVVALVTMCRPLFAALAKPEVVIMSPALRCLEKSPDELKLLSLSSAEIEAAVRSSERVNQPPV